MSDITASGSWTTWTRPGAARMVETYARQGRDGRVGLRVPGRFCCRPPRSPRCGPARCPKGTRSPSRGSPDRQRQEDADLIPLCHPIGLRAACTVDLAVTDEGVDITGDHPHRGPDRVEMEALTSVAVAGLALIDMVKAIDPAASITDVRVEWRDGGEAGEGPVGVEAVVRELAVTVSNRAAAGVYADKSGPVLVGVAAFGGMRRGGRPAGDRGR